MEQNNIQITVKEIYEIQITVGDEGVFIDFDFNMPCFLADKIKEVVKDFYKEKEL